MESVLENSQRNTDYSIDYTTISGENICLTSTPTKTSKAYRMFEQPEFKVPLGPPPPLPAAPKPRKPITRMRIGDMAAALTRNMANSQQRLRTMSFKREELECRFHRLQSRTESMRIRDQQIKRRFEEIREKRFKMTISAGDNFEDEPIPDENEGNFKRRRFVSKDCTISRSESNLGVFRGESSTRKATAWKNRKDVISMFVSPADEYSPLPSRTETQSTFGQSEQTPKSGMITSKAQKKVRRPPSFRLKTFIQKKFKYFA